MDQNLIYLDSCILQKDMRIRLPKNILINLNIKQGKTYFNIYYDPSTNSLILKSKETKESSDE